MSKGNFCQAQPVKSLQAVYVLYVMHDVAVNTELFYQVSSYLLGFIKKRHIILANTIIKITKLNAFVWYAKSFN